MINSYLYFINFNNKYFIYIYMYIYVYDNNNILINI